MKIDKPLICKLEKLARLKFTTEEQEQLCTELTSIFQMIKKLDEVDTSKVKPLTHLTHTNHVLRADIPKAAITVKEALKNAPKQDGTYFQVPKVK